MLILFLTGCGKRVLNEEQIAKGLVNKKVYISKEGMWTGEKKFVIDKLEEIKKVKLLKRKTIKDKQTDLAYVNLIFEKNGIEISGEFIVKSVLFDKGWEVEEASLQEDSEPTYKLVSGINEKGLKNIMTKASIKYGKSDYLRIEKNGVREVKIISQDTDLDSLKDQLVFEVEFENKGMIIREKIEGEFKFEKGKWASKKVIALGQISYDEKDKQRIDMELVKTMLVGSKIRLSESDRIYGMERFKGVYWNYNSDEVEEIKILKVENIGHMSNWREVYLELKLNNKYTKSKGIVKFMCEYEEGNWTKSENSFKGINFVINHPEKSLEDMKKDVVGKSFFCKGFSMWTIKKDAIKDFKILKRTKQGDKEIVIVAVELLGQNYRGKGQLKLQYDYERMGWNLRRVDRNGKEFVMTKI
jgi:hypothetical protein